MMDQQLRDQFDAVLRAEQLKEFVQCFRKISPYLSSLTQEDTVQLREVVYRSFHMNAMGLNEQDKFILKEIRKWWEGSGETQKEVKTGFSEKFLGFFKRR